jgi:hypothetical protein
MARLARIVLPGIAHHVSQRGNRRETTFFTDADYRFYLDLLGESADAAGTRIWAYCLMPNHVHVVAVPQGEDGLRATFAPLRRADSVGRPVGSPAWLAAQEARLGRPLAPGKRGPKRRTDRDVGIGDLFSALSP